MKTVRYVETRKQPRGADGKKVCKVCEKPLPKHRSSYCSQECWYRNTPGIMRNLVRNRDHGICALCGHDCEAWQKHNDRMRSLRTEMDFYHCDLQALGSMIYQAHENFKKSVPSRSWQADHIIPVVKGGGLCGLDGYRTLCDVCHKVESKKLAAERAREKRCQKPLPLLEAAE